MSLYRINLDAVDDDMRVDRTVMVNVLILDGVLEEVPIIQPAEEE